MASEAKLSQYQFTGAFRRRPNESLLLTNDSRQQFLDQVRFQREAREWEKKKELSALKIQSVYRSFRSRKRVKNCLRAAFDASAQPKTTLSLLVDQLKRLVFFFAPDEDGNRLLWVCQRLMEYRHAGVELPSNCGCIKRRFLGCCLSYLNGIAPDRNANFTLPLRVIETYAFGSDRDIDALINADFLLVLRRLFECRVHLPDVHYLEVNSKMPGAMAEALFDALLKPFSLQLDSRLSLKLTRHFCDALFCRPLSTHVICCILPGLAAVCSTGKLNFERILDAILSPDWLRQITNGKERSTLLDARIKNTASLAYSLLVLAVAAPLESSNFTNCRVKLLACLSAVLPSLLPLIPPTSDDDFGEDKMEIDLTNAYPGTSSYLLGTALSLVQKEKLVHALVSTTLESNLPGLVNLLSQLCYTVTLLRRGPAFDSPLLYALSFKCHFIRQLWQQVHDCTEPTIFGQPRPLLDSLQRGTALAKSERDRLVPLLSLFCVLLRNTLLAVNDDEFYENDRAKPVASLVPFSLEQLPSICEKLRNVALGLIDLAFPDSKTDGVGVPLHQEHQKTDAAESNEWNSLFDVVVRLLQLLHERDCRLQFCVEGFWSNHKRRVVVNRQVFRSNKRGRMRVEPFAFVRWMTREEVEEEGIPPSASDLRNCTILRRMPFVVPFFERVQILHQLIENDKRENGREDGWGPFGGASESIRVRRNYIYEDAMDKLSPENVSNVKHQIRVVMTNWHGLDEAGIDGGGIFREFLSELLKEGFSPARGFFKLTPHENLLYPNPVAPALFEDHYRHYYFLGRMLGKLLYENQMAELRFASFFLAKLLHHSDSENVDIHHLLSLDPVLYRNLLSVKYFEDDVRALELDFSVMVDNLGQTEIVDLKPGGRDILVDNGNKLEFVHLMADFYLNKQIRALVLAFRHGMSSVVDLDWLCMFDHREMQILISGADADVDIEDMRRNTRYAVNVNDEQPFIEQFWSVVSSFTPTQKRLLLRFITGCSRPPLMGFKDLYPPLAIQLTNETDRLPSAATCMNLLKLPQFRSEDILRQKLCYAIESGAGFELS